MDICPFFPIWILTIKLEEGEANFLIMLFIISEQTKPRFIITLSKPTFLFVLSSAMHLIKTYFKGKWLQALFDYIFFCALIKGENQKSISFCGYLEIFSP